MQKFLLNKTQVLDNVEYFKENSEQNYCDTVIQIIESKPFGDHKFYIFQFVKRVDDVSGIKKMFHQPRLTKPEPLPGTTLLKCDPKDPGSVLIVWTLPNNENFNLYKEGKVFADEFVWSCIEKYKANPMDMCKPDPGDLTDDEIRDFYRGRWKKTPQKAK